MTTLFDPLPIGAIKLSHRIVMAPLTRSRSELPGNIPNDLMRQYYSQRVSTGGLIIAEATNISQSSRGWLGAPGLYSAKQVEGWRKITSAVHAKKGHIFAQLWHTGRASHITVTEGTEPVSSSVNPEYWQDPERLTSTPTGWIQPSPHRELKRSEIPGVVEDYRAAAVRARDAGFDGVELHAANGYLVDQFLQDGCNKRTDEYGGSIENRARFVLEVVEALTRVWGQDRVGVRIGPDGRWNGMSDSDPWGLFTYVATRLNRLGLAYLHIIEPRVRGNVVVAQGQGPIAAERLRKVFTGKIIAAGGFEPATAEAIVKKGDADFVAFGRYFVSNPDLPVRIRDSLPLSAYDRNTFYTFDSRGYTDYPTYSPGAAKEVPTMYI
jgi:N-ethylmaleimide reductase